MYRKLYRHKYHRYGFAQQLPLYNVKEGDYEVMEVYIVFNFDSARYIIVLRQHLHMV
jgi:hypothetical protein